MESIAEANILASYRVVTAPGVVLLNLLWDFVGRHDFVSRQQRRVIVREAVIRRNIEALPSALIALRAAAAPLLILAEVLGAPGIVLAGIVAIAFVSDVFDGIVARLLGTVTDALRGADSLVDTIFYVAAVVALVLRSPGVISANAPGIAIVLALEVIRQVVERIKYGRMAAYHMWSAKLWGITLLFGFLEAFLTGKPGTFFTIAVFVGIATDIEGLAASLVLSRWHHDVPTIWHAIRLERDRHAADRPATSQHP